MSKYIKKIYYVNGLFKQHIVRLNSRAVLYWQSRWLSTATQVKEDHLQDKTTTQVTKRVREMRGVARSSESFILNMFLGKSHLTQVFPYPEVLTLEQSETLDLLIPAAEKFMKECNDPSLNDFNECVDKKVLLGLRELGTFGMQVPTEYGGIGLTNTQYVRMVEIIGKHDLGLAILLGSHQSIGYKGIVLMGTPEQKAKYLQKLASGEILAAFSLTEPSAGSDASSIRSRAVLSPDGKHYVLNGSKIWISNGGLAEVFTVFAQTPVTGKDGVQNDKVTAFIVERSFGGLTSGPTEKKMGIKASDTTEVFFDDVKIPVENVLGGVGNGFKVAMEILNNGRFGMAAALSGSMRETIHRAVDHAKSRVQFGQTLNNYESVKEKLSRMAMRHYVTESLAYMVSSNMDSGSKDYHLEAAVSKVFSSESAWLVTDDAIQLFGGMGFMRTTGLERVLRDIRIFRIFEGANDVLRLFIALTGLQFAGGHLQELQTALKSPASNMGLILGEGTKRAKRAIGMTNISLSDSVHPNLSASAALLSRGIEAFGISAENLLMKYGKRVVDKQFLLHRLADSAIDLYSCAAVLSRASLSLSNKLPSSAHEEKLARVWINEASDRVQLNLTAMKASIARQNFNDLAKISEELCEGGGVVPNRPVEL